MGQPPLELCLLGVLEKAIRNNVDFARVTQECALPERYITLSLVEKGRYSLFIQPGVPLMILR
jgi:hypothetical protein